MSVYLIAACVLSTHLPHSVTRAVEYAHTRGIVSVRCCVSGYKDSEFRTALSQKEGGAFLSALPQSAHFSAGDTVYTLCENCANILAETRPELDLRSFYRLIEEDDGFPLPDLRGKVFHTQPCFRAMERREEQEALTARLLRRCGATLLPCPSKEDFCGLSLYRPQPPRNPAIAPRHYAHHEGKFLPHTKEEQLALMRAHCRSFVAPVVTPCHYCLEGLLAGGCDAHHLLQILFG